MIFIHASTNATNGPSQIFPVSLADFAVLVSFFFFVLERNRYGPFVFESLKSPPKCYRITNPQRHGIIGTFTRFYYLQCMHLMWILIVFPIPFDLHIELREKNLFSFQFSDPIHEEGIYLVLTHMKYGTLNYRWLVTLVPGWHIELSLLPTTLRKRSVTLFLWWVIDLGLL